jgi:hypothetical protein
MAFVTSSVLTMWYLSKTAHVLWPLIFICDSFRVARFHEVPDGGPPEVVNDEPLIFIPRVTVLGLDQRPPVFGYSKITTFHIDGLELKVAKDPASPIVEGDGTFRGLCNYAPLTAGLLKPFAGDRNLAPDKRSQLDRLTDDLLFAVGLKIAA